jgi:hypothetical protein
MRCYNKVENALDERALVAILHLVSHSHVMKKLSKIDVIVDGR